MPIKCISVIVLLLFLNGILACSSIKTVSVDKLRIRHAKQGGIIAAVLTSGDVLSFNDRGGEIDFERRLLSGITKEGDPVNVGLRQISILKVNRATSGKREIVAVPPQEFLSGSAKRSPTIIEIHLVSGETITFDEKAGKLGSNGDTVIGKKPNGQTIETDLAVIHQARVEKLSVVKTAILAVTTIGVFVIVYSLISSEDLTEGGPTGPPQQL